MAHVHPSRRGRVPPSTSTSTRTDAGEDTMDREQQLRQRLLESRRGNERRPSPTYDSRPPPQPYRDRDDRRLGQERSMYPSREDARGAGGWNRPPPQGGDGFFASRNEQRKQSTLSIWPPSPRSPLPDSEDEREKERERKRKHSSRSKHRSSRDKERDGHRSSRRRRHESDSDSEEESRRRKSRRSHSRREEEDRRCSRSARSPSSRRSESKLRDELDRYDENRDEWERGLHKGKSKDQEGSDEEIGPQLPLTADGKVDPRAYGSQLLPGEGSAMAAYLQEGKRIPRRGEIGLSSDQIESFENVGYVMSGSRHKRMNAVRVRKENQVISAEERRSLLKLQAEEKAKKEAEIVSQFRELVDMKGK